MPTVSFVGHDPLRNSDIRGKN